MIPRLFPWRHRLKRGLALREPHQITLEWLSANRWWWKHVPSAIDEHYTGGHEHLRESARSQWRAVEISAFIHELIRRCNPGRKLPPWPLLPRQTILALAGKWTNPYVQAGRHTPAILRPLCQAATCMFEPVHVIRDPHTGEPLWNRNEPAWTEPVVLQANLATGNEAIIQRVRDWLNSERERTGIKSPAGGEAQGIGKELWKHCEVLDTTRAGLGRDEVNLSRASKARALWNSVSKPPSHVPRERFLRVALRDILKHGKILPTSLPPAHTAK